MGSCERKANVEKILVFDGNSILNRAFYGVRPLTAPDGLPTNAIFGFINILLKNIDAVAPTAVAVAFDLPAPTFRHQACETYKANRKGMPDALAVQLPFAKDVCGLLGYTVVTCEGYEADAARGREGDHGRRVGQHQGRQRNRRKGRAGADCEIRLAGRRLRPS